MRTYMPLRTCAPEKSYADFCKAMHAYSSSRISMSARLHAELTVQSSASGNMHSVAYLKDRMPAYAKLPSSMLFDYVPARHRANSGCV